MNKDKVRALTGSGRMAIALIFVISSQFLIVQNGMGNSDEDTESQQNKSNPRENAVRRMQLRPSVYFERSDIQRAAIAIDRSDMKSLSELKTGGIDVNHVGNEGFTLLLWAMLCDNFTAFQQLLVWGADPNSILDLKKPMTLYDDASIIHSGDSITYIAASLPVGRQYIEACVNHGGDMLFTNRQYNETSFGAVCRRAGMRGSDRFRLEEIMIQKGANIDHRDIDGRSPVMNCFHRSDWTRTLFLIEKGASVVCYDGQDRQLIHLVASVALAQDRLFTSDPTRLAEWNASSEKKEFDRIVALLEERGFSLEEAKTDVRRRNEMVDGVPYMKWRRMQREDKDACSEEPAKSAAAAGQPEKKVDE